MFKLSNKSKTILSQVHIDLQILMNEVIKTTTIDFTILEGIRTIKRQKELVKTGKSKTLNSKHLTGRAIDIAPYPIDWNNINRFIQLSEIVKKKADELGIKVVWGGDWKGFVDMPHWELR